MKYNSNSIIRSEQLHHIGQSLNEQINTIQCEIESIRTLKQKQQKEKILYYLNATEDDWNNWEWQMKHRINSVYALKDLLYLTPEQTHDIDAVSSHFRFAISPYYFSLIDPDDINNPIGLMSIPNIKELSKTGEVDPSAEEITNPTGKIIRRYPNRVIINITNCCASLCRHCQRKRIIGTTDCIISHDDFEASIAYIKENQEINDVLITGGDALTLTDSQLQNMLSELRKIRHIDIIRIGSRTPVNMPQRITTGLINVLKQYAPIYLNTQFNHPLEITPESTLACKLLSDNGIVLGNQMVLLNEVNNNKFTVQLLNKQLLKIRVRPYYIFHPKNIRGTLHFHTSITEGIKILEHLWGNTSGLSIPRFIVSAPNGLGKIEITKDTLLRKENDNYVLTTWEGIPISIPYKR